MNHKLKLSCATAIAAAIFQASAGAATPANLALKSIIDIPGAPLTNFDVGFVDPVHHRYYFSDRANKSVDGIDTANQKFLFHIPGFSGAAGDKALAKTVTSQTIGPNGVVVIPEKNQLWAGNGASDVKVFNIATDPPRLIADVKTGGKNRVDEVAYDPKDHLVVASNDTDTPPFLSFISTTSDHRILGKLPLPNATDGLEQPRYNTVTGMIYQSMPSYKNQKESGGFAVINPATRKVDHVILVKNCSPAGNAQGPGTAELMACQDPGQTVVVDVATGKIVKAFPQVGGSDEAWYDPATMSYYLSARDNPSGPVLGVINAATNQWVANLPTAKNSHSVAADPHSGAVYVPMAPNPICAKGCVAVFAPKSR